jgi:3-hydroxybutyryl-CoA dehydratase
MNAGEVGEGGEVVVGLELPALVTHVDQRRIDAYSGVRPHSIHTDEAWARRKGFRAPLAQGMMSTAYVSELMVGLLGTGVVEGGRIDVTFLAPVFAGDTLTVRGVVSDLAEDEGGAARVLVAVRATNGEDRLTMAGTASGLVLSAEPRTRASAVEFAAALDVPVEFDEPFASNRRRIDANGPRIELAEPEAVGGFRRLAFDALTVGESFVSDDRLIRPEDLETYAFAVDDHHPWFTVGDDPAAPIDSPYGCPIAHPTLLGNQALFLRHTRYVIPAGLHAKMSFELLRPIRLGVRARSRGRVVDTYRRRGRGFMVTEFETVEEPAGDVLVRGRFTQMLFPDDQPSDGPEAPC